MLPALEGVEKSVVFLRNVLVKLPRSARVPSPRLRGEG